MAWIVSKMIGDGKSIETAFRFAAQRKPITVQNEHNPVNKQGIPLLAWALLQVPDNQVPLVADDPQTYVFISGLLDINARQKLFPTGLDIDLTGALTQDDVLNRAKVAQSAAIAISKDPIAKDPDPVTPPVSPIIGNV